MPEWELPNGIGYAPEPEQRMYRPPVAPEPFVAPRVTASAVNASGTPVERAHAAITHAQQQFKKHVAATNETREHYSDAGYQAQLDRFQHTEAAKDIDRAVESVQARRDSAAAQVEKIRRELSPNGSTDAELRATRYTARIIRQLDSKDSGELFGAADELIQQAIREELGVLLQELGPYLKSRGSSTDWIDAKLDQLIPEYRKARRQLGDADKALQMIKFNAGSVRRLFSSPGHRPVLTDPRIHDPDKA